MKLAMDSSAFAKRFVQEIVEELQSSEFYRDSHGIFDSQFMCPIF